MTLLSAIERLKEASAKLPLSTPEGSSDGIVWQNFNVKLDSIKGAVFEKIDQAYTCCFSCLPGSGYNPMDNILRGSYGMDVVIRFFEECAQSPKLDSGASHLTELKVGQLTDLVYARIKSLPHNPPEKDIKKKRCHSGKTQHKPTCKAQVSGAKQSKLDGSSDSEFSPQSSTASELDQSSSDSDLEDQIVNGVNGAVVIQDGQNHVDLPANLIEYMGKRRGRSAVVREWAFTHHNEPIASFYPGTQKPAWMFKCKYCPSVHHFSRTNSNINEEKISATNLAAHLNSCKNLPAQYKLMAVKGRFNRLTETLTPAQASLSKMFQLAKPSPGPVAVTPSAFDRHLFRGFPGIDLPVHSTMRKDLNKLYEVLSACVRQVLSAQNSRFAITSNAWTSKSFVYSLGGVVITFIDESWNMQELVLDIVHLDADHTGARIGWKIFKSLDNMNAARNVIASVTDNASNNQTLNAELSTQLSKKYGYWLNVNHMSIICLCHALHLVCGAIFSNLKVMDPMDQDEIYAIVKSFEDGEVFEQSAEVLEEEERLRGEENDPDAHADLADTSDDEWDDIEAESQPTPMGSYAQPSQILSHEALNCVQKVHCIVVDITSSPARRKRMRTITRALGLELRAVIKSVKVRWNSILAEIRRAILLKPAINQYVATLDEGKSGVALRKARALKKKLTIGDEEWDALIELVQILRHFEAATRDYSTRGKTVLHSVLPTYAILCEKLIESRVRLNASSLSSNISESLVEAIKAGEGKLDKYFDIAIKSDLTLLASIFHPGMRLRYFQDTRRWGTLGEMLVKHGQELIEYLYELYKQELDLTSPKTHPTPGPSSSSSHLGWIDGLLELSAMADNSAIPEEVRSYLDGKYQYKGGDILVWWKENESHIPVLSRAARDILAIPATSVSVERLFSRCKLVMSDYRNMSVDTARQIITCQQWLDAGLGAGLPDFLSNDCI